MHKLFKHTALYLGFITAMVPPLAQSDDKNTTVQPIEEVFVSGVRRRLEEAGALADTIIKTEVIGISGIENSNAVNLSEAIDNSPGVRVSNDCSMCGFKRILLNGLKGEHTTILIDGLPSHTLISGFYAMDAIPTTGIERIEVARGAGASLIAPEAIGGTINIITREAEENAVEMDLSTGENGYRKVGILGMGVSEDGASRLTLIGQYDVRDQFDADDNNVSESAFLENSSLTVRLSHDLTQRDNLVFRYANISSEVFGGPILGKTFADGEASSIGTVLSGFDDVASDNADLFAGGDVRNDFTGKAWETGEWIKTRREELSLSWLREINDKWNVTLSSSYSDHEQDSFYEGFDYFAEDEMLYLDARFNWIASDKHLLTFGVDNRSEEMRSDTRAGEQSPDYVSDSFDYDVLGLYIQDTWNVTDDLEISLALRFDQIEADFVDAAKPGTEIDEELLSPRLDLRYMHSDRWTSRFSAGRGYRAPLSFFETDHGILDALSGFDIQVDELERSVSTTYALSFEGETLSATTSLAYTEVGNLAGLSETDSGVPALVQTEEEGAVAMGDIALTYRVLESLSLSFIAEIFDYDDVFQESFNIVPVEERITLSVDWDFNGWDVFTSVVWSGSSDLEDYGYEGFNQVDTSGVRTEASRKTTDSPSYYTVAFKVSKELSEHFQIYVGANNLFDYTQAGDEDGPLMFDDDSGYDVAYIYGPLRGREAYAGIKLEF